MSIAKVSEISTTSTKGFQDAIDLGLARAHRTLRNVRSSWITKQKVRVKEGALTYYQVSMTVAFVIDNCTTMKLRDALLCVDCESLYSFSGRCPHCCSQVSYPLARALDRTAASSAPKWASPLARLASRPAMRLQTA